MDVVNTFVMAFLKSLVQVPAETTRITTDNVFLNILSLFNS